MAKLELTLYDENGYSKVIKENYISGQKLLDYLKLLSDVEKKGTKLSTVDYILMKVDFLASLFTVEKVTSEQILQGVRSWELIAVVDGLLEKAMGIEGEDPKLNDSLSEKLESDI